MVSGHDKVSGMVKLKVKDFNKSKFVYLFILDDPNFSSDLLIGLDLIKEFSLRQNENSEIFQRLRSNRYNLRIR